MALDRCSINDYLLTYLLQVLGSKGQSSRLQCGLSCSKMHFWALLMRCLENYWTAFYKLSELMHFAQCFSFWSQRSRSQHDWGPSG